MVVCSALSATVRLEQETSPLTVATGEEWFATEHLGEDAAHAPDVNRLGVLLEPVVHGHRLSA